MIARLHIFCIPAVLLIILLTSCQRENDRATVWYGAYSPEEAGRLIIEDLLSRDDFMMYRTDFLTAIHYAEACAGFGAARFAGLSGDTLMILRLKERYAEVLDDTALKEGNHVDANVYGILPLELYMQTGDERFLSQGLELADLQWADTTSEGLTSQVRFWIDDIWMIVSLQVQAYRATGDEKYLDRAAAVTDAYLKELQQENGLFHHGPGAPFYWGRGNGWVAAGLAELLYELPERHTRYPSIKDGFTKMADALIRYQARDGMWRQLIDVETSWKETSSTAMFGYAISTGVKKGILKGREYKRSYQNAWSSLTGYINEEGEVTEVCVGTGKSDDINYYLNRPRTTGDLHGQAPVLWFAYRILREDK